MATPIRLSIPEILSVAGLIEPREELAGTNWSLWYGQAPGFLGASGQRLLFLSGDCGWQDIEAAAEALRRNGVRSVPVIVRRAALRVREDLERVRKITAASHVLPVSDFLFSIVYGALGGTDHLTKDRADFGLQYFVEPHLLFPSDVAPAPAIAPLMRWLRGDKPSAPSVAVLLAPAGLGKTTLCEEVFRRSIPTTRTGIVPLLLKREQWANLAARGSLTMLDIWTAGIGTWYPRALMGADQLERCLSAGVVRPILDGFDELCSFFPSDFSPTEIVTELLDVVEEGRVLITSRTQFWEENVSPAVKSRVLEIELHPFSANQRDSYLEKRFPDAPPKRAAAVRILDRLGAKTQSRLTSSHSGAGKLSFERLGAAMSIVRFDSIPFVVALAAESADVDDPKRLRNYGVLFDSSDPLEDLLLKFCERERLRHRLNLKPEQQLGFFQTLAIEFGPELTTEDIALALQDTCDDDKDLVSLCNHALLVAEDGRYRFRYDFVEDYLIARVVSKHFSAAQPPDSRTIKVFRICAERQGALIDRCVDLIFSSGPGDLLGAARSAWLNRPDEPAGSAGLTRVLVEIAKRLGASSRLDQTDRLLDILGDSGDQRSFEGLRLFGPLVGLDLSGVSFSRCIFVDAEFTNCTFDSNSVFSKCMFEGKFSRKAKVTGVNYGSR